MNHFAPLMLLKRIGHIFLSLAGNIRHVFNGSVYCRKVIEDLGGGFIKLAQILALRYEILPKNYCEEFANLFDRVRPMGTDEIKKVFREEFGKDPEKIFRSFDYRSWATASFGVVHVAWLNNNKKVAVKIQRPKARLQVKADILILNFLASLAGIFFTAPVDLKHAMREWKEWTEKELDYIREAKNAVRLRSSNNLPYFYIPEILSEISTSRVLVSEFLEGWSLNDIIYRKAVELSDRARNIITERIVRIQLIHYFKDGFFHADPHPGNIILLKDGRLGYVDFGIVGEAGTSRENYHFAGFIKGAAEESLVEAVSHFKEVVQGVGLEPEVVKSIKYAWRGKSAEKLVKSIHKFMEDKLSAVIKNWADSVSVSEGSLYDRSTARHFLSLISLARRLGMKIPMNLLAFIRAVVIADMVCLVINPKFNMKEELKKFFENHPEVCVLPSGAALEREVSLKVRSAESVGSEYTVEKEFEERQRLIEKYLEHAGRILEKILDEGPRGLAYFVTTKF